MKTKTGKAIKKRIDERREKVKEALSIFVPQSDEEKQIAREFFYSALAAGAKAMAEYAEHN